LTLDDNSSRRSVNTQAQEESPGIAIPGLCC
jgi:hypothetical protein